MRKSQAFLSTSLMVIILSGGFFQPVLALEASEENTATIPKAALKPSFWDAMVLFQEGKEGEAKAAFEYFVGAPIARGIRKKLGILAADGFLDTHEEQRLVDRWLTAEDELKKLMKKKDAQFSRSLRDMESKSGKNGALFYLLGQYYETGHEKITADIQKAKKLYFQAFDNGDIRGVWGLARILEKKQQLETFLEGTLSVLYVKTLYDICCRKETDESDIFWEMAQQMCVNKNDKKNSFIYTHCVYAAALHGKAEAQHCLAMEHYHKKNTEKSLFWAMMAAEQGNIDGLRLSTQLLQIEKIIENNAEKTLTYLQRAAEHPEANAGDFFSLGLFHQEKGAREKAEEAFQKGLDSCCQEDVEKRLYDMAKELADRGDYTKALFYFEQIKGRLVDEKKMHYLTTFHLENPTKPLCEDLEQWLHQQASKHSLTAICALAVFMARRDILYDIKKLITYTQGAYEADPHNLPAKYEYAFALERSGQYQKALDLFLTFPKSSPAPPERLTNCYMHLAFSEKNKDKARDLAQKTVAAYGVYAQKAQKEKKEIDLYLSSNMYSTLGKGNVKGEEWLTTMQFLAEVGISVALCELGNVYSSAGYRSELALELEQNDEKAAAYYQVAYKKGFTHALSRLFALKILQGKQEEFLKSCTDAEKAFLLPYQRYLETHAQQTWSDSESDSDLSADEYSSASGEDLGLVDLFAVCRSSVDQEGIGVPIPVPYGQKSDSQASTPCTPQKKNTKIFFPEEIAAQKKEKRRARALDVKQSLERKGSVTRRELKAAFNTLRKVSDVEFFPGKGSGIHVRMGRKKTGYHQPHGIDPQTVDKGVLKRFTRQFSEILKEGEDAL